MTSGVTILAKPKGIKKPFILMMTESRTKDEYGNNINDEKKIFEAGNALMTTGGNASNEYREWLQENLIKFQHVSLEQKNHDVFTHNQQNKDADDINMVTMIAQFDNGVPSLAANYVGSTRKDALHPVERQTTNGYWFRCTGTAPQDLVEELNRKLYSREISLANARDCAERYIKSVADRETEYCNKVIQYKVLFK